MTGLRCVCKWPARRDTVVPADSLNLIAQIADDLSIILPGQSSAGINRRDDSGLLAIKTSVQLESRDASVFHADASRFVFIYSSSNNSSSLNTVL